MKNGRNWLVMAIFSVITILATSIFASENNLLLDDVGAAVMAHRQDVRNRALAEHAQRKGISTAIPNQQSAEQLETANLATRDDVKASVGARARGFESEQSATTIYKTLETAGVEAHPRKTWGNFPETAVWTGGWINPTANTKGGWGDLKHLQWFTTYEKPENFGIGGRIKFDKGSNDTGYDWGYLAPGATVGYYRGMGLKNAFETDVSILYRMDQRRDNGVMPVLHAEFTHQLDYKNKLIFQADGSYFPGDSWFGPGVYWENKLDKDWKVILGGGGSFGWLDGDFISGFQPSIRFKYLNRWNLGFNANLFTGLGTFWGVTAAYELTPDINTWWEKQNAAGVKKISEGVGQVEQKNQVAIRFSDKTVKDYEGE